MRNPEPPIWRRALVVAVLGLWAAVAPAHGQVAGALPQISNPTGGLLSQPLLPAIPSLDELDRTLDSLEPRALLDAQRARLRDLVRTNRRVLETDADGWPVMRGEILALSISPAAVEQAQAAGFRVLRETRDEELGLSLVVLEPPRNQSVRRAIAALRRLDPAGTYEYNHVYQPAGAVGAPTASGGSASAGASGRGAVVGLIDTGVDARHPALRGAAIEQKGFAGPVATPGAHGTAVASLLVGDGAGLRGSAPGARLLVADVYGARRVGGSAESVALALGWMARRNVPVITISLVGPRNAALETAVRSLNARGHLIVAAVGNDGPAAPPLYPAAVGGVVGVSALNGKSRVLPEAARGPQVDFSAPGADMAAAGSGGSFVTVRGTSFAAPLVAGLLARRLVRPDAAAARAAFQALAAEAADLGVKGNDPVYGHGAVAVQLRTPSEKVRARGRLTR